MFTSSDDETCHLGRIASVTANIMNAAAESIIGGLATRLDPDVQESEPVTEPEQA